jgi:DNA polymerase elongation subunit (family B)
VYHAPPEDCSYVGAFVFDPEPGLYEHILPFDFSSLYPTTIIAYNIDYSTLVPPSLYATVPQSSCHCIEWEETGGKSYSLRFIKEPKGVLPSLLEHLLERRRETKKEMKTVEKNSFLSTVLDKRQLAYKISANSVYGAMGVQRGRLPFLQGAMATTAMGRKSIQLAARYIQETYNARLIYGDTDSIYCCFPTIASEELWSFAHRIEKEFAQLFPDPMRLVFEEKVYRRFMIFTKKRYIAVTQNMNMTLDHELTLRGVLLARRDNCMWIRRLYEKLVRLLMGETRPSLQDIEYVLVQECNALCSHTYEAADVVISKAVGKDYKVLECPGYVNTTRTITDDVKRRRRLKGLGIDADAKDWYRTYCERVLPAHCQLAAKMGRRGHPVQAGSRVEFLMIEHVDPKAKTFWKIEDPEYVSQYADVLCVDFLYVLHLAMNSIDQLLGVCYGVGTMVKRQYTLRQTKHAVMNELRDLFHPKLTFQS